MRREGVRVRSERINRALELSTITIVLLLLLAGGVGSTSSSGAEAPASAVVEAMRRPRAADRETGRRQRAAQAVAVARECLVVPERAVPVPVPFWCSIDAFGLPAPRAPAA